MVEVARAVEVERAAAVKAEVVLVGAAMGVAGLGQAAAARGAVG